MGHSLGAVPHGTVERDWWDGTDGTGGTSQLGPIMGKRSGKSADLWHLVRCQRGELHAGSQAASLSSYPAAPSENGGNA